MILESGGFGKFRMGVEEVLHFVSLRIMIVFDVDDFRGLYLS